MKNLFNNLLLNYRFVFQNAEAPKAEPVEGEKPKEGPEASTKEGSEKAAEGQTDVTKKEGAKTAEQAKNNYNKAREGSPTNPIRLGETVIKGYVEKMKPEVRAKFDDMMAKLENAKNDRVRAKLLSKFQEQATDPVTKEALSSVTDFYTAEGKRLSDAEVQATLANREKQFAQLKQGGVEKNLTAFANNKQMSDFLNNYVADPKELLATFQSNMKTLMDEGNYDRALTFAKDIYDNTRNVQAAWNGPEFGDKNGRIISAGKRLQRSINTYRA